MTLQDTSSLLPPTVVIDTNVLLDWLVFREAGCAPLAAALETGRLRWIATPPMREELGFALNRRMVRSWAPDLDLIDSTWSRLAVMVQPPAPTLVPRLRCTDPDDQMFIDLALHEARWLITRDRAVLKLARRAAALGVTFATPERWHAAQTVIPT